MKYPTKLGFRNSTIILPVFIAALQNFLRIVVHRKNSSANRGIFHSLWYAQRTVLVCSDLWYRMGYQASKSIIQL